MANKFHGVFSLILISAAVVMALVYLFGVALGWGLIYLGIVVLANPLVLYSYCSKCLCRDDACSHVLPGKLARLLPLRESGPYTLMDYLGTALPLIALIGFPQFWLWQNRTALIFFWIMIVIGLIEILIFVCRDCSNTNCLNCKLQ